MPPAECRHLTWMYDPNLSCAHCGASMLRATREVTLSAYRAMMMERVRNAEVVGEMAMGLPEAIEAAFAVRGK